MDLRAPFLSMKKNRERARAARIFRPPRSSTEKNILGLSGRCAKKRWRGESVRTRQKKSAQVAGSENCITTTSFSSSSSCSNFLLVQKQVPWEVSLGTDSRAHASTIATVVALLCNFCQLDHFFHSFLCKYLARIFRAPNNRAHYRDSTWLKLGETRRLPG